MMLDLQIILRRSLRDTLIAGSNVPAGAGIMLHLSRGNRDPAEFTSPDTRLPGRSNVLNNLAFSAGRHACPGARLAMLEGDAFARVLTSRFRQISAERDGERERHPALQSFAELPVVFHV